MVIRKALPDDAPSVLDFYYDLIDAMRDRPIRPTWTKGVYPLMSDIQDAAENGWLYIAECENGIIGSVIVNNRQNKQYSKVNWQTTAASVAVIHLLAVSPALHGNGIGRKMLEKAREVATAMKADAIRLDTLPYNAPARQLYQSFGFQYCGDIDLYYPSAGTIPFSMYEYDLRGKTLVSACLFGKNCRWDGGTNFIPEIRSAADRCRFLPVCPEELGGLPTPRKPSERLGDRVVNCSGEDVTEQFSKGAEEALRICLENNCKLAVLKSGSPSCGKGIIHNGMFNGGMLSGNGVTAQLLIDNGIEVLTEQEWLSRQAASSAFL